MYDISSPSTLTNVVCCYRDIRTHVIAGGWVHVTCAPYCTYWKLPIGAELNTLTPMHRILQSWLTVIVSMQKSYNFSGTGPIKVKVDQMKNVRPKLKCTKQKNQDYKGINVNVSI